MIGLILQFLAIFFDLAHTNRLRASSLRKPLSDCLAAALAVTQDFSLVFIQHQFIKSDALALINDSKQMF